MVNAGDNLKQRFVKFTQRLEQKQKELENQPHQTAGQHMGHLVDFRKEHEELKRRLEQPGISPEKNAHNMIEADFNSLLDRFDRWVRYIDEEYDQMR